MKEWQSFCETLQSDGLSAHAIIRPKSEWVTRGVTLLHLPPLWQLWHRHFLWHTLWQTEHAPLCLKLTTCSWRAQVAQVAQKVFKVRCALHIQVHEALSRETWKFKKVAKLLKVEGCQHCNHCVQQHGKEPIKNTKVWVWDLQGSKEDLRIKEAKVIVVYVYKSGQSVFFWPPN